MIILGVDPGRTSGATVVESGRGGLFLREAATVEVLRDREIERVVIYAQDLALARGLTLVGALEDWGSGGERGLSQWVGLGESRGMWRRALHLLGKERGVRTKIITATQSRWRGRIIEPTGVVEDGKWRAFTSDEWKAAALEAAQGFYPDAHVPPLDAAESACLAAFVARSDEAADVLGERYLKKWEAQEWRPLEHAIKHGIHPEPKPKKKKKGRRRSSG